MTGAPSSATPAAAAGPTAAQRALAEFDAISAELPDSVAAATARASALRSFAEVGVPPQREDSWKYSSLRALEAARFTPAACATHEIAASELPAPIGGYQRHVFVDGHYSRALSSTQAVVGVTLHTAADRSAPRRRAALTSNDHRFAWLNEAFAADSVRIAVMPELESAACIEVIFVATCPAARGASYPRMEIHVGADSALNLIERHVSVGADDNLIAAAVQVSLDAKAECHHYRVQQTGHGALWVDTLDAHVGTEARYDLYHIGLGGQSARSTLEIELGGEHAKLGLHAVVMAANGQVQDIYAIVNHTAARTQTEETFRGIAGARSRAAFNGKIVVGRHALGTDSRQSLRGLIAGPQAEVDARPQLEIYTDDVRCSHGATVGKLDDTMLFYLLSRGLERATAEQVLKWAFLSDVIAKIGVPELRAQIEQALPERPE